MDLDVSIMIILSLVWSLESDLQMALGGNQ